MSSKQPNKSTRSPAGMAIAACTFELASNGELQLMPAGNFRARDGRPTDAPHWHIDGAIAAKLIAAADQRITPYVADYEHQTLLAKQNGQPAPAAGFFKTLEWREGVGLFAVAATWTPRASQMIADGEYKFVSPVFAYDKVSGDVTAILMAGITNNPAIDGMDEVMIAAATQQYNTTNLASLTQELPSMNIEALLEQLRWLLNLPIASNADDILAELAKVTAAIKEGQTAEAAATCNLLELVKGQRTAIASLTASLTSATPDPAKYVALSVASELQGQVAALTAQINAGQVDIMIGGAMKEGRLQPAMESWARDLGTKDIAALTAYLKATPAIAALTTMQSGSVVPPAGISKLSDSQITLCTAMGVTEEAFLKTLNEEKAA